MKIGDRVRALTRNDGHARAAKVTAYTGLVDWVSPDGSHVRVALAPTFKVRRTFSHKHDLIEVV